jgi:phage-related protein
MKEVIWHTKALEALRIFPEGIRKDLGYLIHRLQMGDKLTSPYSKPIRNIEIGVNELRVKDSTGAYRVFYYLKTQKGILIFHAFKKKTQKTPKREIEMGKKNLKELFDEC